MFEVRKTDCRRERIYFRTALEEYIPGADQISQMIAAGYRCYLDGKEYVPSMQAKRRRKKEA